jgi:ubiquinone/menaquinone biosynthesis C-methylase UbiE
VLGAAWDATWGRVFAWGYDGFMNPAELRGLRDLRRGLLAEARGRTLELGAGTGANVELYPEAVTELVLTEPSEQMAARLRRRLERSAVAAAIVATPGEELPFADASFDTVTVTMVLCTVDDPDAVLHEVARVLRPGGSLLFLEHVRSDDAGLARWQDRLERPWRLFGHGCRPNRDALAYLERSPLRVERVEAGSSGVYSPTSGWRSARCRAIASRTRRRSSGLAIR